MKSYRAHDFVPKDFPSREMQYTRVKSSRVMPCIKLNLHFGFISFCMYVVHILNQLQLHIFKHHDSGVKEKGGKVPNRGWRLSAAV